MDFIVSIFMAEMVAISIENYESSILLSIIPILVLVGLQMLFARLSLNSKKIRNLIDGVPSVIINKGQVDFKEMKKQRYNLDDLLTQLRANSIKSLNEVDYAVLETNGKLSVFKKQDDISKTYPLPIIIDGIVDNDVLLQINKDKKWLSKELEKMNVSEENIFYAFYKNNKIYIIENKTIK